MALSRTGSNLLAGMLDSHPEVLCHHEIYNPTGIHRSLRYKGSDLNFGTMTDRNKNPWAFATRVFGFTGGAKAVGFKMGSRQDDSFLLSLILDREVHKIILHRRHWVEQFVSQRIAEKTNVWSNMPSFTSGDTSASELVRVRVEPGELLQFIRKRKAFFGMTRFITSIMRQPVIHVAYEDLNDRKMVQTILQFLGVDPDISLKERTRKQATISLADRIENYAELQKALQETRYSHLL